ncbi:MAG: recombination regulator RecX [Gemmatimonadales bacterium]|nr:recombination regulator RecX [Gemmatimonadales bacterium]
MQRRRERSRELPLTDLPVEGEVTAIRERPRTPGRYLVEIDGRACGPVSAEILGELSIRVGTHLGPGEVQRLLAGAAEVACHDRALGALARRARSTEELRRWLRTRGFEPAPIERTLDRLTTLGLLDDEAFARGFAHGRATGRMFGARRIAAELARRGVASGVISRVMAELRESTGSDESAAVEAAAARRARSLRALQPEAARRRLTGWLLRRGFGAGEVQRVVRSEFPPR